MGLFDKVKSYFTEENEDTIKPVRKEIRHEEVYSPRRAETQPSRIEEEKKVEEPVKEEKFVFFDDKDFEDLKKATEIKQPIKKEKLLPYQGAKAITKKVEEKKKFKPTPIISPVYGVLDKNYSKEDIKPKIKNNLNQDTKKLSIDDVRKKAFGTFEDDFEGEFISKHSILLQDDFEEELVEIKDDEELDFFGELEQDNTEQVNKEPIKMTRTEKNVKEIITEIEVSDLIDKETEELSKQLEEQKKKLDQINSFIKESSNEMDEELMEPRHRKTEEIIEEENLDEKIIEEEIELNEELDIENKEDLTESELFNLIDSMYEKRDDK
ncbi:MAG: hypothetical protein ACK5HP_01030 [Bacilli bacterium]